MKKYLGVMVIVIGCFCFPGPSLASNNEPVLRSIRQEVFPTTLGSQRITANAVLVQPDQKILVAGTVWNQDWDFTLLRYCPDGALDDGVQCGAPGFGAGGRVETDFGGGFNDTAYEVVLQPDGKIILAGTSSKYPQTDFAAARYHPDGSLDPTFDGDGLVKVDFQNNSDDRAYAVTLQPDGKIILGGVTYITTWGDFALVRLCPEGALDNGINCGAGGFGAGGKVWTDFSNTSDWINAVEYPDGLVIAGGSGGNRDFAVARYTSTGALDNSFSGDGKQTAAMSSGWDYGQALVVQPDGKIILGGGGEASSWNHDFALARFDTNGNLDGTFSGDGKLMFEFSGYSDRILGLALDGTSIIAVGYAMNCFGNDFAVAKMDSTGNLDPAFGVGGKVVVESAGFYDAASSVGIQGDGKYIVAGYVGDEPSGTMLTLARFFPATGNLDTTFNGDGKVTTSTRQAYGLGSDALVSGGRVYVAGWQNAGSSNDLAVARFLEDGSLDASFGGQGIAWVDFSGGDERGIAIGKQSSGLYILASTTYQGANGDFALARIDPQGNQDLTFGINGRVVTDFGQEEIARDMVILPDDGILVVGTSRACPKSTFAIARYDSNGLLDPGFSEDGWLMIDFPRDYDDAYALAVQPDGKIVVAGGAKTTWSDADFALARLCPDGALDDGVHCGPPAFSEDGMVLTDFSVDQDEAHAVAILESGKIVAAGDAYMKGNDFALVRYCPDGTLDNGSNCGSPGFGSGGKITTDFAANWDTLNAILPLKREKILACGYASYGSSDPRGEDFIVALYDFNGLLDLSFSGNGWESQDLGSKEEACLSLALGNDGKVTASGVSGGRLFLVEYPLLSQYLFLPLLFR